MRSKDPQNTDYRQEDDYAAQKSPDSAKKDDCWIATAYYGDVYHFHVLTLRNFRNRLIVNSCFGPFVKKFNQLYYALGRTKLGMWWSKGLRDNKPSSIRRMVSHIFLQVLLLTARQSTEHCESREK